MNSKMDMTMDPKMDLKIRKMGETDVLVPKDETQTNAKEQQSRNSVMHPSYRFKDMKRALFHIMCDLKESNSPKPSECSEKESENKSRLAHDAETARLDRCLEQEGIFRKGSNRHKTAVLKIYIV